MGPFFGNRRGSLLLTTFVLMTILIALTAALIFTVMHETRDVGSRVEDIQMIYLAEAGVERAMREIRNDYQASTQTGIADLRGDDTSGSVSVGNVNRIRYEEDGNAAINANTDIALLRTFDANYTRTRIIKVELGVRASRQAGGTGATMEAAYAIDGVFPNGNTKLTQALTAVLTNYYQDITADRTWDWATLIAAAFTLRAVRTAGNRDINLDYLFLRVTYEIDTPTEPWFTGTYQPYPLALGAGAIQTVSIRAEQGKVHLNTASQALLRYLMVENGIADGTANPVATNIVAYRTGNPFDTIEELQQVGGVTPAIYSAMDQDVTVYSFINPYAQGPAGARAPVNINFASRAVLEALFDPLTFTNPVDIPTLATAIINQRGVLPFTCFYSSELAVFTDFYGFILTQGYLNNAERDRVFGNADASTLVPREGGSSQNAVTTEFSYDTNAFRMESVGRVGGRDYRVKTVFDDQGAKTLTTYVGDPAALGWRQENFE